MDLKHIVDHVMEDGMDIDIFDKFDKVYSGHYHTRSDNGKIYYLGNPYEMFGMMSMILEGLPYLIQTLKQIDFHVNNPYRIVL